MRRSFTKAFTCLVVTVAVAVWLGAAGEAFAASPGSNGAIAFSVGDQFPAQQKNLIEISPDGAARAQISGQDEAVNDLAPVFSPDGNRIAFGACSPTLGGCGSGIPVYVANADGTDRHFVTSSTDGTATWSPDGSKLAVVDEDPELGIYIINSDGTGRHLLIKGSRGGTGSPTWSPDGQRIAFFDDSFPAQPQALGLYLVDVAGDVSDEGRKHLLLADQATGTGAGDCNQLQGYTFDWSPNGDRLLYHCLEPDGLGGANQDIAAVDVATGQTAKVVSTSGTSFTGAGLEWFPRWSPDGTAIVYERESAIWVATVGGAQQHIVANAGYRPSWQPCTGTTARCGPARQSSGGGGSGPAPGGGAPPSCSAGSPTACPTNKFKVGSQHATHRGTTFSVNVPGAGTVSIAATKRTRGVHKHGNAAGVVKLVVKPTSAGRRALKSHSQITARPTVTFTPDGGLPKSTKARIKFIR